MRDTRVIAKTDPLTFIYRAVGSGPAGRLWPDQFFGRLRRRAVIEGALSRLTRLGARRQA